MDDRLRPQLRPSAHWLAACCLLVVAGGCSVLDLSKSLSFDLSKNIPWGSGADGQFTRPRKLIAVWRDTVLHQDGQAGIRGFGGRVWFYGGDEEKPVEVEGMLEVYAFDETDRKDTDVDPPDRKYVFTAEDVQKHYSETKLGDSYSFWLPWGDANGPPTEISLICRFTPSDGSGMILGETTRHQLPGREVAQVKKRKPRTTQAASGPPRAYEESAYSRGTYPPAAYGKGNPKAAAMREPAHPEGLQERVAPAGYFAAEEEDGEVMEAPTVQTPLGMASRMRVTTLQVPNHAGGVAPYTTSTLAYPSRTHAMEAAAAQGAATAAPSPPATGYPPGQRRALGGPIERLTREHDPRRPNPARWQSSRSLLPQSASPAGSYSTGSPAW
jgi:hypothetical protein